MSISRGWVGTAAACAAMVLGVWMAFMAGHPALAGTTDAQLPGWLCLDTAELAGLVWVSRAARRHPASFSPAAMLTAGLLLSDATIDVATSISTGDVLLALGTAVLVEIPAGLVLLDSAMRQLPGRRFVALAGA